MSVQWYYFKVHNLLVTHVNNFLNENLLAMVAMVLLEFANKMKKRLLGDKFSWNSNVEQDNYFLGSMSPFN